MKKISLILLVAALLFVFMSTSLADGVSYNADSKTVTITSDDTGFVEIWIDGRNFGYMTGGSKTVNVASLGDGTHTVFLEGETASGIAGRFTVGATEAPTVAPTEAPTVAPTVAPTEAPTVAPTEAPTEAPTVAPTEAPTEAPTAAPTGSPFTPDGKLEISASYVSGRVNYTVSGLSSFGELWLDGKTVGKAVSSNGSGSIAANLAEGSHTLTIHVPDAGITKSASFTVEFNAPVINSVSYDKEGNLFFSVSNITNFCEVWVDSTSLGKTVSADGTYPVNKTLAHGPHTLTVHCPDTGKSASFTFTAHTYEKTAAVEATCEKDGVSAGIKCSEGDSVLVKPETIPALGHDRKTVEGKAATCTEKGLTDGEVCARCGKELKEQTEIAALGHDFKRVGSENGRIYYKCNRCGFTYSVKDANAKNKENTYGSILKDVNNVFVDYTANGNGKILVITADLTAKPASEIGLYLDADLIAQIQKEGYTAIEYINDKADIVIELAEISSTWFDTDSAIWFYVFSTDPAAEEGTLVKVEAQISGEDKVAATAFAGVTFKAADGDVAVTENGVY